jgi:ABC-type nitrate/sulfonate/bicarbonate transport system substrate-binding protein
MNEAFSKEHPGVAEKVMTALVDAYDYYRQHVTQANAWFLKEARLKDANQKACNIAASIEPNLKAKKRSDIRVSFTDEDFKLMQSAADFLEPALKKHVDMRAFVSNKYVSSVK